MPDEEIAFTIATEDEHLAAAFARGAAERGGRRRTRATADPDAVAHLLPPFVSAPPRRSARRVRPARRHKPDR